MSAQISIIIVATALISGLGGFVIGRNQVVDPVPLLPHERLAKMHAHEPREVETDQPVPTIELVVHPDNKSGYNLELITTNFNFAPQHASTKYEAGEGHAHLYINQERIGRLYGHWHHIQSLPKGLNLIRVGLSGNDHTELTHNSEPIAAEIIVDVE